MSRYLDSNRLRSIRVAEKGLSPDILPAVLKASLEFSTTQTSQMVIQIADPDLVLVSGGFMPKGTPVTYARLKLEVAVREIVVVCTSSAALQVTCRSTGTQRLRRGKGPKVWRNLSWTAWAKQQATTVGLGFLGQPSAVKKQIVRKPADKGTPAESTWDVLQAGASELGFLAFEAQGVLYFGQPTWLAANLPQLSVRWHGAGSTQTDPGLLQVPVIRDSDDDVDAGYTGSLSVTPDLSEMLAPPAAIRLYGVGPYSARYLSTDVSLDLDGVTAASVSIETPVNPEPQPDTSDDSSSPGTSKKAPGTVSGYDEKTGNALGPKYVPTPIASPDAPESTPRPYVPGGGGHRL